MAHETEGKSGQLRAHFAVPTAKLQGGFAQSILWKWLCFAQQEKCRDEMLK